MTTVHMYLKGDEHILGINQPVTATRKWVAEDVNQINLSNPWYG